MEGAQSRPGPAHDGRGPADGRPPDQPAKPDQPEGLLALMLAEAGAPPRIDGVVIGKVAGFDAAGMPLVDFDPNRAGEPLPARATVALDAAHVGREVALLFEQGDPRKPIVMGLMWDPGAPEAAGRAGEGAAAESKAVVQADGERFTLTAEREIVLRCGEASITLTRAGKVLIRGKYVLSRSSGVNRIQGGSVQIN